MSSSSRRRPPHHRNVMLSDGQFKLRWRWPKSIEFLLRSASATPRAHLSIVKAFPSSGKRVLITLQLYKFNAFYEKGRITSSSCWCVMYGAECSWSCRPQVCARVAAVVYLTPRCLKRTPASIV